MSEQHRQQVMRHMETQQITPPANPQRTIENSTKDIRDERCGADGKRKRKHPGAFDKLKAQVDAAAAGAAAPTVAKALPVARPVWRPSIAPVAASPTVTVTAGKPAATFKSLNDKLGTLAKSLGVVLKSDAPTGSTSLEAGYSTNVDGMTGGDALRVQSLPKKVFVKMEPAPLTAAQVEKAASAALSAGAITGAEANQIATYLAIRGACPEPLLKKLRGESE